MTIANYRIEGKIVLPAMDINDIINPIQSQSMCISEYNVESISDVLLATTIQEPKMYKKVAMDIVTPLQLQVTT